MKARLLRRQRDGTFEFGSSIRGPSHLHRDVAETEMTGGTPGFHGQSVLKGRARRIELSQHTERIAKADERIDINGTQRDSGFKRGGGVPVSSQAQIAASQIASDRSIARGLFRRLCKQGCSILRPIGTKTNGTQPVQSAGMIWEETMYIAVVSFRVVQSPGAM